MGPNLNLSYAWNNPKAFSFEIGGSFYGPAQRLEGPQSNQQFTTEPYNSFGPRFYLTPSYAFDRDFSLGGIVKLILPNGYPDDKAYLSLYDGGGLVFGINPALRLWMDDGSFFKITGGYDDIIAVSGGTGNSSLYYYYWTFGTSYEVRL
jgi:hypothetical protein